MKGPIVESVSVRGCSWWVVPRKSHAPLRSTRQPSRWPSPDWSCPERVSQTLIGIWRCEATSHGGCEVIGGREGYEDDRRSGGGRCRGAGAPRVPNGGDADPVRNRVDSFVAFHRALHQLGSLFLCEEAVESGLTILRPHVAPAATLFGA